MGYTSLNLAQIREENAVTSKQPFQHQIEAFEALNKTFNPSLERSGSEILVLPTGAGKTFTAVRWLSNHIVPKNIKILWLAPSFYLLDQAAKTFCENSGEIPEPKRILNIRCVSSNISHSRPSSIQLTDDVVIMTVQTAISNLHTEAVDKYGNTIKTAFRRFIEDSRETGLFVVIDEAHHSPAYGCRNLLISDSETKPGIRYLVPNHHFLGLTATPTHMDKSKRGWLGKIFQNGIIYEADKASLITQKILAKPNYIEVSTGKELEVDDRLYDRLVKEHKDLPEDIIEKLASDRNRNNFIVETYISNKESFGKTIIFADRCFQCVYLKEKLIEKGIKADAIYSQIDADPGSAEARNKLTQNDTKRILEQFKTGRDLEGNTAPLDVLINVRMLTEGADVPNVETVFITRQTTSSILMTQMIGRALRGEKAGGGSGEANVVLFFDDWKRLIDWATPLDGETKDDQPLVKGSYPLEYISIRLIEQLSGQIESGGEYKPEYSKVFPVGWYKTEILYADSDDNHDSMEPFTEFVMVYEHTQPKFASLIESMLVGRIPDTWAKEYIQEEWMLPQVEQWIDRWFDRENDDIGGKLKQDLIKITRHIAQNQTAPIYHSFEDKDLYDLEKLALKIIDLSSPNQRAFLTQEFVKPGALWKTFYKSFSRFKAAVDGAINKILDDREGVSGDGNPPKTSSGPIARELTEEEKEQVKKRDWYTCLCCGASGKGVRLQIDHIVPLFQGGETSLENSQTLCSICNRDKGINELNFRFNSTLLSKPKALNLSLPQNDTDIARIITRIVNFFYHCHAVYQFNWHEKGNGAYYSTWEIILYKDNNPDWLLEHKVTLLNFIQSDLRYSHVQDIRVTAPK